MELESLTYVTTRFEGPGCGYVYEQWTRQTDRLNSDGSLSHFLKDGEAKLRSASGACARNLPRVTRSQPARGKGRWWRETPTTPPSVGAAASSDARAVGNVIYFNDEQGRKRVLVLGRFKKLATPKFEPVTMAGEAQAFERFLMSRAYEETFGNLSNDDRDLYVSTFPSVGKPMEALAGKLRQAPDDLATLAKSTAEAAQSGANWVGNNPGEASLMALATAVGIAFPISAFAGAGAAGGAVLKGAVGTAMVAGTTGFVSQLFGTVFSDETLSERLAKATARGAGEAAASLPGSLAGPLFEKAAGTIAAGSVLTVSSGAVGVATDVVMQRLTLADKATKAIMDAPSFAADLLQGPDPDMLPEIGGVDVTLDR